MKQQNHTARNIITNLLFVCASLTAVAHTFTGTITETVTTTDDPAFYIGQTFIGTYQYESSVIDGDFGAFSYTDFNPEALPTLQFNLFGFFPTLQGGWLPIEETNYQAFTHLVVTDSIVTDFYMTGQYGAADPNFRFTDFHVSNGLVVIDGEARSTFTAGTLVFSAPTAVPESAPGTAALLAVGLCGLMLLYHPLRKS